MPSPRRGCAWRCRCPTRSGRGWSRSWSRSSRDSTELRDELPVEVVAEQLPRFLDGHPAQLVDLGVRGEVAALRVHLEVAHELQAVLVVAVAGVAELPAEAAAVSRLLLHLPERGLLEVLTLVELALRKAPVVVLRPVHHQDVAGAQHEPAGGEHFCVVSL